MCTYLSTNVYIYTYIHTHRRERWVELNIPLVLLALLALTKPGDPLFPLGPRALLSRSEKTSLRSARLSLHYVPFMCYIQFWKPLGVQGPRTIGALMAPCRALS